MIGRRLVLSAIILATFGTACTAIVLGKIGDKADYTPGAGGSSSSSGGTPDKCSLLTYAHRTNEVYDANPCSTCIETECKTEVDYACNGGKEKDWFSSLANCARSPWGDYQDPSAGASFYGCKSYEKELEPIPSGDDAERKRASEICVHDKCLQGTLPACKLCEVSIAKTGTSDRALLRDDKCGGLSLIHI